MIQSVAEKNKSMRHDTRLRAFFFAVLLWLAAGQGRGLAQDLHYSQFYNALHQLNPALTGVFQGDVRVGANYRQQWSAVPVPYLTVSGYYDQKIYLPGWSNGLFGGGLVFDYDRAGDAKLQMAQLSFLGSYTHRLGDQHYLSAGVKLGAGQRAFNPQALQFDDQYNGDIFVVGQATQEVIPNDQQFVLDMGAGVNYFFLKDNSRTQFHTGVGFRHLNTPLYGFWGDPTVVLPLTTTAYMLGVFQLEDRIDLTAQSMFQWQGAYKEWVTGAGVRYHFTTQSGNAMALQLGVSTRLADAWIVHLETYYNQWHVGLSYDINTSPFRAATDRNGGPELSIQYIITKIKTPEVFKSCPIF